MLQNLFAVGLSLAAGTLFENAQLITMTLFAATIAQRAARLIQRNDGALFLREQSTLYRDSRFGHPHGNGFGI